MKTFLKYIFLAATIAAFSQVARATPVLQISATGATSVTIWDGSTATGAVDLDSEVGGVTWDGTIGGWTLRFNTGLTKPALGSATDPQMDLNFSAQYSGGNVSTLLILFSDNDFTSPGNVTASIGGTAAGAASLTYATFGGASNTELAYGVSNRLTLLPNVGGYTGSFSGSTTSGTFIAGGPYELTLGIQIQQTNPGLSTGDALLTVPDSGTTLLLLGAALTGLGLFGRLRKRVS
jgi:hypothetical protein